MPSRKAFEKLNRQSVFKLKKLNSFSMQIKWEQENILNYYLNEYNVIQWSWINLWELSFEAETVYL